MNIGKPAPRWPLRAALLAIAVSIIGLLITSIATAQSFCGKRDAMVAKLANEFEEFPSSIAVIDEHTLLEVFVSAKGSWTILASGVDGSSCVLSSGEGWTTLDTIPGRDA